MNIAYFKGRYNHAKALGADVIKVDIEELASLIEWIEAEDKRIVQAMEYGKGLGKQDFFNKAISEFEKLK